ncbi:predicted protein [Nematostella vectensis]|uniref:Uncharacterized protein n=1 Tax=Nematostella vectensis TaxID=45351 RepID=A7T9N3_NEMVE|nr:predicted protein [Nematostella vectensis]|eukprot:XP_001619391.1 hypothetical protein NEMVEDRAFT_v1g224233 [Nematostella vectensis]
MKINSFFGTEEFYTPLVCLMTWVIDAKLGRLICFLMGIGFYVAGFVKNLLCLPRPSNPPIVPLEPSSFETWGLPSHHAVLGVLIPWYIWLYSLLHFNFSQWQFITLFAVIVLCYALVMITRAICKEVFMFLISLAYRVVDIEYFSGRKITNYYFHTAYSSSFKLPPVEDQKSKRKIRKVKSRSENIRTKWNIDYPVRFLTYACMGWMCICGNPLLCHSLGLTL